LAAGPSGLFHATAGALAPQPQALPVSAETPITIPPSDQFPQGRLFPDTRPAFSRQPKVVSIEGFAPDLLEPVRRIPSVGRTRAASAARGAKVSRAGAGKPAAEPLLETLAAAPRPRKLPTTVEAVITCEAPVAATLHRVVAATLDWSMVVIGYGLFLAAYYLAGGEFVLRRPNLLLFAGAYLLAAFFYGVIWALAGAETAGMRWAGLRLTNFDGFPPDRGQRWLRFWGTCLSFGALGLGVWWALADEENLTWQDHISRTFPTPRDDGKSPIVRRP
jgi:uncharacterized RDD family membrane protein YckC